MALLPKEVKQSIVKDLKDKSISRAAAAEMLGMGTQTYANLLSQQKYFSRKMAERFHEKFGYSIEFLMTGIGDLLPLPEMSPEEQRLYDESKEKQSQNNWAFWDRISDRNFLPPDPTESMFGEYYSNFDIDKNVTEFEWETKSDERQAYELLCAFHYQLDNLKVSLDYSTQEVSNLKEENIRLRLENMALRRVINKASKEDKETK